MKHYLITAKSFIYTDEGDIYEGTTKKVVGTDVDYPDVTLDENLDENFIPIDDTDDGDVDHTHERTVFTFKFISMSEYAKYKVLIASYENL